MELRKLALYPFLPETADYVRKRGLNLDDVLQNKAFTTARALGRTRVLDALEKGDAIEIGQTDVESEKECIDEILSYVVARILVSCIDDNYLTRRYSIAEAYKANSLLQKEDIHAIIPVSKAMGITVEEGDEEDAEGEGGKAELVVLMHFLDYIRITSKMREREWKLVNRAVGEGLVRLDKKRLCRIIEQAIRIKMEADLPLPINERIKDAFEEEIATIQKAVTDRKALFEPSEFGTVELDLLPPCMKKLIGMIQASENVPHSGRFAMVAFLHIIGMKNEDILGIFHTSPDFNDSIAKYQIEHITGTSSDTEYTPPSCETMKSYSICFNPDDYCKSEYNKHPLSYYRYRLKLKRKARSRSGGAGKGPTTGGKDGETPAGGNGKDRRENSGPADDGGQKGESDGKPASTGTRGKKGEKHKKE